MSWEKKRTDGIGGKSRWAWVFSWLHPFNRVNNFFHRWHVSCNIFWISVFNNIESQWVAGNMLTVEDFIKVSEEDFGVLFVTFC